MYLEKIKGIGLSRNLIDMPGIKMAQSPDKKCEAVFEPALRLEGGLNAQKSGDC